MKKRKAAVWLHLCGDVVRVSPGLFALEYLSSILYSIALALTPFFMERVFSRILSFANGTESFSAMMISILLLFGVSVLSEAASGASDYLGETYANLSSQKFYFKVNEKIGKLPALDFEKPDTLNLINKSYQGAFSIRDTVHVVMDILTIYLPYFIFYGWYLYRCRRILPLILALIFLPVLLAQIVKGKLYAKLEDDTAPLRRKKEHFSDYIAAKEYVKETRGLGATAFFEAKFQAAMAALNRKMKKTGRKTCEADGIAMLMNLLGYIVVLLLLLDSVLRGYIALSAFVAVFASIRSAYDQMEELLGDRMGELADMIAKVRNYIAFQALPCENTQETSGPAFSSVRAEHLCFSYPNGTQALHDISFEASRGQMVAIVGENGSGKTTLSKILAGIYPPTEGCLLYAGQAKSLADIRKQSSQLFQKYNPYKMTVAENVAVSDNLEIRREEIKDVLNRAKAELPDMADDPLNAMLGREFGGVELSGGQWQRIALARGIYRPCQVLILDEPTAAIDPMRESELYQTFRDCCQGKIGFIVTHRLGIVKLCSQILVLKQGTLVDMGTHEALLERCEYYRMLWNAQAELYQSHS